MCGPLAIGLAAGIAGSAMLSRTPSVSRTDPEAERIKAEQEATTRTNAQIASDQRRRRSQRGLLALGTEEESSLGPTAVRSAAAQSRSLLGIGLGTMGSGAGAQAVSAGANVPGGYYGGGGTSTPSRRVAY